MAFGPDGQTVATAGSDCRVIVFDARDGHPIRSITEHADMIHALAFSPDGRTLPPRRGQGPGHTDRPHHRCDSIDPKHRSGSGDDILTGRFVPDLWPPDGTIATWDLRRDVLLAVLHGHSGLVNGVALGPTATPWRRAARNRMVRLWDIATGQELLCLTDCKASVMTQSRSARME